jgi:hypothetical protein
MTIFFLAMLAPVFAFYVCALVNFQRELLLVKREKLAGARAILVDLPRGEIKESVKAGPTREVYQLESAYAGPLFVAPVQEEDVPSNAAAARTRLVSTMHSRPPIVASVNARAARADTVMGAWAKGSNRMKSSTRFS